MLRFILFIYYKIILSPVDIKSSTYTPKPRHIHLELLKILFNIFLFKLAFSKYFSFRYMF